MNVTVNSQVLAAEVRLLSRIVTSKPTIPILGHLLLRANEHLHLSATDLEVAMNSTCSATVHEPGAATLPAKALLDILEQIPDADVTISDGRIASGAFKSRLASLPADDFPTLPQPNGATAVLPAASLRAMIERVAYAISDKEGKYILRGALLSLAGEVAAMVATDGKRLSVATTSRKPGAESSTILPGKALDAVLAQAPVGDVEFSRGDRHIFFDYGRRLLISRMIESEFPNYQRIIPRGNEHVVRADRAALLAAIRRVGILGEATVFRFQPGSVGIAASSAEIGEADESVPINYDGPEITLWANWKFMLDFLEHAVEPSVTIKLKDPKTPMLLTDGTNFINVVMTMSRG